MVFQTGSFVAFASTGVEFALQTAQSFFKFKKGMVLKMKKVFNSVVSVILVFVLAVCLCACTKTVDTEALWKNATYQEDAEFGNGAKTVAVEVKVGDRSVTFTIHTDKDTVGAALLEHELIAGEEGPYGLYVKSVNGITADYDVDQSYWAFNINGETALTGVDGENITEGKTYQLEYAK